VYEVTGQPYGVGPEKVYCWFRWDWMTVA
jgi:hypothetical protein